MLETTMNRIEQPAPPWKGQPWCRSLSLGGGRSGSPETRYIVLARSLLLIVGRYPGATMGRWTLV